MRIPSLGMEPHWQYLPSSYHICTPIPCTASPQQTCGDQWPHNPDYIIVLVSSVRPDNIVCMCVCSVSNCVWCVCVCDVMYLCIVCGVTRCVSGLRLHVTNSCLWITLLSPLCPLSQEYIHSQTLKSPSAATRCHKWLQVECEYLCHAQSNLPYRHKPSDGTMTVVK